MKTGKSYTLENLVPAVLAQELSQQRPDHPLKGMTVLRLNCLRLDRQGTTALLYSLLEMMLGWVEGAGVKVKADAWEQATRVRGDAAGSRTRTRAGTAILELLQGLETPVLVLMDELQALLQPLDERGEPDLDGVSYIRDVVLRQILVASPDHVLWAVTGSSMAFVWTALAAMPVVGVAPILQIRQVDTPSVWPPGLMAALGDDLEGVWGVRPEDVAPLLERAGSSPALFMTMLEFWVMEGRPADVAAFADTFTYHKLYKEALREWQLGPAHWTDEERGLLLDLTDPVTGAAAWELHILYPGLQRFLEPHLKQTGEERSYLADPTQRQLLRAVLMDNNGKGGAKLRQQHCWAGLPAPGLTLVQRDWGWLLLHLGQVADHLLLLGVGVRPPAEDVIPKDAKGIEELKAMLRDLADKVEPKLPAGGCVASRWEALGIFTMVLGSPHNKGRRSWYQREGRDGKLRSHLDYLVFFLRLCRDVVARWEPREGREVLSSALLALPTLVDMRVPDLSEVVLGGMSQLAAATVHAAAAAAEREDQMDEAVEAGGGGGGGGGSGYDANRRGGGTVAAPAVYGGGRTSSSSSTSSTSSSSSTSSTSSSSSASSTSSSSSASSSWPRRTALGRSGAPSARHTLRLALPPPASLHRVTRLAVAPRSLFRFAM